MSNEPYEPNELEIALVEYARGESFQTIGIAMEAGRHVEGDAASTELFARAASLRHEETRGEPFFQALLAIMQSEPARARLSRAYDRIERAQVILRRRIGEGWDGAEDDED